MHIISTINPNTRSEDDIPVILVTLGGKSKFLPRSETYKEMQRLVRAHYDIDPRAALQFEVSTWDVCAGRNVEVTEAAYAFLAPLLDSGLRRDRVMPTPSATPPLRADDGTEDEESVREHLEPETSQGRATGSPSRRAAPRPPKVESEDEETPLQDSISVHDEEEDEVPARPVKKEIHIQAKEEPRKTTPKARGEPSQAAGRARGVANRSDDTVESSQLGTASDTDERFKIFISGPRSDHKAEFMTRGGHLVRKVLSGACKTFELDVDRAKLMLCVSMPDEDGEIRVHQFECAKEETIARSGVKPQSRLVILIEQDEVEDEASDYDD